eukprot:4751432-Pyramimonas_sp.AAC.1
MGTARTGAPQGKAIGPSANDLVERRRIMTTLTTKIRRTETGASAAGQPREPEAGQPGENSPPGESPSAGTQSEETQTPPAATQEDINKMLAASRSRLEESKMTCG